MSTNILTSLICFFLLASFGRTSGQSITPSTINIGGGSYAKGYYQFDWSIGEGISVQTFQSNSNLIVTTGILQPFTGKAPGNGLVAYSWAKDELSVFPVPTRNTLEVDINTDVSGMVTLQIYNLAGSMVLMKRYEYFQTNNIQKLDLTGLVPGIYYLHVSLDVKKGTFKIQKL